MASDDHLVLFRRVPSGLRRRPLQEFALALRDRVARGRSFVCLITDDRELRRLNRRFRAADYPTDVLSFPAEPGSELLGELAISAGRAALQAREYGHSRLDEIRVLMLHGVLHLTGLDHETDDGKMRRAELRWRKKLALPSGLIDRAAP